MRHVSWVAVVMCAACSTLTPAQNTRNEDLFTAARSCETGSLTVTGISTDGAPETRTTGSGGSDKDAFVKCFDAKATPIWRAYCEKEPNADKCARK
ncbi:MAG TPA: hypothetical protein VMS64_02515 [Candidatus Methylomirabilis sp.]|nr:hypothetical protein [Candidatus Methylomirabilis sp.]